MVVTEQTDYPAELAKPIKNRKIKSNAKVYAS